MTNLRRHSATGKAVRKYARLGLLGLTLALGPTSLEAATASNAASCRIQVREVTRLHYGPTSDNLTAFKLQGSYSSGSDVPYPGAPFEILDLDGFATLAFIHAQWRSSGIVDRNLTEPVTVPVRDVRLIVRVVEMGQIYFDVLERNARASNPSNLPAILVEIDTKRQLLGEVGLWSADALFGSALGGDDSAIMDRGVISRKLGAALERFVPGSSQRLFSQYRDLTLGSRPQVLCNPEAESVVVGQLLCGFVFTTADRRTPDFCPDGLLVNELAAVRSCKMLNGVESECRSGVVASD